MNDTITKLKEEIDEITEVYNYLETKRKELYSKYNYMNEQFVDTDTLKYKIEDLKYLKSLYEDLNKEGIDITKKYYIMDNVYLQFFMWNMNLTFYIYFEDDNWFYNNYIDSHSGLNEWLFSLVNESYSLYSGNSSYCHAFGTCDLKRLQRIIENRRLNSSNEYCYWADRRFKVSEIVRYIKELIDFFTDEDNKTKNIIVDELQHRFDNMKSLVENRGE